MARGSLAAALAEFRRGSALAPENADLRIALGEALLKSGMTEEAKKELQHARKLSPGQTQATDLLKTLESQPRTY